MEIRRDVKWTGRANCSRCSQRKHTLFASLTPEDLKQLSVSVDKFEFPTGTDLFLPNEQIDDVFVVTVGLVKASISHADNVQRVVRLYKPGDVVGLETLLDSKSHHQVSAISHVSACRIPSCMLRSLLEQSYGLMHSVLRQSHDNLQKADYWLTELSCGTVEQRILALLHLLCRFGLNREQLIELPVNSDIAAIVNTTKESVSREIAKLKRNRILQKNSPHMYRFSPERLIPL